MKADRSARPARDTGRGFGHDTRYDTRPDPRGRHAAGEVGAQALLQDGRPDAAHRRALARLAGAGAPAQCADRRATAEAEAVSTPDGVSAGAAPGGRPQPLPGPLQRAMQALSGLDLRDVRVHADSAAPARLGAQAMAQGRDIHLGPGQQRWLPHEAWHVVQQRQGRVRATVQMAGQPVNDDPGLEAEADRMAALAAQQVPGLGPVPGEASAPGAEPADPADAEDPGRAAPLPEPVDEVLDELSADEAEALVAVDVEPPVEPEEEAPPATLATAPGAPAQLGKKTTPHDNNYVKRVKKLIDPHKLTVKANKAKHRMYRSAKRLAQALDANDHGKLVYRPWTPKGQTQPDPNWRILVQSRGLNKLLKLLNVAQERVHWFQQVDNGGRIVARRMKARLVPGTGNLMEGSNTNRTNPMYFGVAVLERRKNSVKKSPGALYIKGHLLNDHLGGGGVPHNLVPLTAEKLQVNRTGSNDANGIHNKQVEEPLKRIVEDPTNVQGRVRYEVVSLPPAGPRPQTAQVVKYAADFHQLHQADGSAKVPDLIKAVEKNDPALADIGRQLMSAVGKPHSSGAALIDGLFTRNAELWREEDRSVPAGIRCSIRYVDAQGQVVVPLAPDGQPIHDYLIPNVLPSMFTAPYVE